MNGSTAAWFALIGFLSLFVCGFFDQEIEKGYIDSFDLSNKLRKPVLEIRKMLSYAQKEGIFPFDANIK